MAHKHRIYGSYPPWGKSVEFSANGGGVGSLFLLKFSEENVVVLQFEAGSYWSDWIDSEYNTVGAFPADASNPNSEMKVFNPVSNTTEYISKNGSRHQLTDSPVVGVFEATGAVAPPV